MKTYDYAWVHYAIIALLLAQTGFGQITIQKTDFELIFAPNATLKSYHDPSQYVNVGKTGGPNIYDFSSLTFPDSVTTTLFQSSQIPQLAARFNPSSLVSGTSPQNISNSPVFFFTENSFTLFANVSISADTQDYIYKTPNEIILQFPTTYNLQWSTTGAGLGVETTYVHNVPINIKTGYNTAYSYIVDGYGTLMVKGKSYQCLRVKLLAVDGYTFKGFNYFTKEGIGLLFRSTKDQNDTGTVKHGGATMFSGTMVTSVHRNEIVPATFSLAQNYPNPFNPTTHIKFSIPGQEHVVLQVYDLLGRAVEMLVDGVMNQGTHSVEWRPYNKASGIYFYRLRANGVTFTRKLLYLK